jgi:hypothetical protein
LKLEHKSVLSHCLPYASFQHLPSAVRLRAARLASAHDRTAQGVILPAHRPKHSKQPSQIMQKTQTTTTTQQPTLCRLSASAICCSLAGGAAGIKPRLSTALGAALPSHRPKHPKQPSPYLKEPAILQQQPTLCKLSASAICSSLAGGPAGIKPWLKNTGCPSAFPQTQRSANIQAQRLYKTCITATTHLMQAFSICHLRFACRRPSWHQALVEQHMAQQASTPQANSTSPTHGGRTAHGPAGIKPLI